MKKLFITIIIAVFTLQLSAQTTAYSVVEFRAKPHTQKDLLNIFNRTFDSVAMNQGGVSLERIGNGRTNGATHRMVWFWTMGEDLMAEDAMSDDKADLLWSRMANYIEEWQVSYSGRVSSWQAGKDKEDHMMLYEKFWNDKTFVKLIKERGPVENVKDYEVRVLKQYQ